MSSIRFPSIVPETTDILIIGAGAAGLSAALVAANFCTKIVILEKMPTVLANATAISGGFIAAAASTAQEIINVSDSPDQFIDDLTRYSTHPPSHLTQVYAAKSGETLNWLLKKGVTLDQNKPLHPWNGHGISRIHKVKGKFGLGLIQALRDQVVTLGVTLLYGVRATNLLMKSSTHKVEGVLVECNGHQHVIRAKKAIILATGGFGANSTMLNQYVPSSKDALIGASITSTGEGLIMALDIGAATINLHHTGTYPSGIPKRIDSRFGHIFRYTNITNSGGIIVNKFGKRFVNEEDPSTHLTKHVQNQKGGTMYLLADKRIIDNALMYSRPLIRPWQNLSKKQVAFAIKNNPQIKTGNTIQQVSKAAGIDGFTLTATINRYNQYVKTNVDQEFKRNEQHLNLTIETPPFTIVPCKPISLLTIGGLKINDHAQVLDSKGNPILGLYAAGEIAGDISPYPYLGGCALGQALTFGRIAGQQVALGKLD